VGFLTRLLIPRKARRVAHPGRAVKRAVTPKAVKRARRAIHPVSNAKYAVERSVATSVRSGSKREAGVFRHGGCSIKHRTPGAAQRCRKGST
jgi:hypothetical protein